MIDDNIGILLHQKSFEGKKLTLKESETLESWYKQQDKLEAALLNVPASEINIGQLGSQISDVLNQITELTQQIQKIVKENDKIRKENAKLFQLLEKKSKAA